MNKLQQLIGEAFLVTCKIGKRYTDPTTRIVTGCDPISLTLFDRKTAREWSINLTLFRIRFLRSGTVVFSGPGHRIVLQPIPIELITESKEVWDKYEPEPILIMGIR